MANFGTYEGHRLLADAMNKSLDRAAQKKRFEREMELKEKQFKIDEWNHNLAKKEEERKQAVNDYLSGSISKFTDANLFTTDEFGNLVPREDYKATLDDMMQHTDLGYMISNDQDGDGVPDLDYEGALLANEKFKDVATQLLFNQSQAFKDMTNDEIDTYFENNKQFAKDYNNYLSSYGLGKRRGVDWSEVIRNTDDAEDILDTNWMPAEKLPHADNSISWTSKVTQPSNRNIEDKNVLLAAIKRLREQEDGNWLSDDMDNLWLEHHGGNDWTLGEDDGMLRGVDDNFEVKVEGGKAMIKLKSGDKKGEWVNMNDPDEKIWEVIE